MTDERFAAQRTQLTTVGRVHTSLMLTDIVGYTRRMNRDETLALVELKRHNQLIRELLDAHRGREVKTIGDAFLAEFAVADDALACALAIQRAVGRAFSGADPLRLRIGLHAAEVEAVGPDVIGDGVNILSRIEPESSPGGLCASRAFVAELRASPVALQSLGPVSMKNIEAPMELFAWPGRAQATAIGGPNAARARSSTARPRAAPGDDEATQAADSVVAKLGALPDGRAVFDTALDPRATGVVGDTVIHKSNPGAAPPLSRSSGIFAAPATELAPALPDPDDDATATVSARTTSSPVPLAPGWPAAHLDGPSQHALDDRSGTRQALPSVFVRPRPPSRVPLIALAVAVSAVALTLTAILWMVTRPKPPPIRPRPVPAPIAAPIPAPQPAPTPVVAAPVPQPTPPAQPAVEMAGPPDPALMAHVREGHHLIHRAHLSRRRKRALDRGLRRLEQRYQRARTADDQRRSAAALQAFLKRHHL